MNLVQQAATSMVRDILIDESAEMPERLQQKLDVATSLLESVGADLRSRQIAACLVEQWRSETVMRNRIEGLERDVAVLQAQMQLMDTRTRYGSAT